ncbi:MAG: hypothetical protein KA035_03660 [Candidatus Levybacteria bacterium]|nr:hypothetical protein [Candidatus Levybacteria bacterium]
MDERKFIEQLQLRAKQQESLIKTVPFPFVFVFVVRWLSYHPWRLLIPLAFLLTFLFRVILGPAYTDVVLAIFKWLR